MHRSDNLRVMQLLCSRICHDLVGPVGAINTALELMADEGKGAMDAEALQVLVKSAGEAGRKLAFFRAVFGLGGGRDAPVETSLLMSLVNEIVVPGKVSIQWNQDIPDRLRGGSGKLLMLMVFSAMEALPRGGVLDVRMQAFSDGIGIACIAEGVGAAFHPEIESVLSGGVGADELTARSIPTHIMRLLAEEQGAAVEFSTPQPGKVALAVLFPEGLSG